MLINSGLTVDLFDSACNKAQAGHIVFLNNENLIDKAIDY